MDGITHALLKAVTTADTSQVTTAPYTENDSPGLTSIGRRIRIHEAYADADPNAQHIAIDRGHALLALQFEFLARGLPVPAMMWHGVEVIISTDQIEVHASSDDGKSAWCAILVGGRWSTESD